MSVTTALPVRAVRIAPLGLDEVIDLARNWFAGHLAGGEGRAA